MPEPDERFFADVADIVASLSRSLSFLDVAFQKRGASPRNLPDSRLVCVGCARIGDEGAVGWRALLTVDDEIATYCPECAREEFGDG